MLYVKLDEQDWLAREQEFLKVAEECKAYLTDDEEEWVVESVTNCLNCRRRRWVIGGFQCMKEES
jgi:hypothetical protein